MRTAIVILALGSVTGSAAEPVRTESPDTKVEAPDCAAHAPPIDCPLRKAGIDPHGMKPFEDVAKYIEFLEREDRAEWQRPDAVVAALELGGDETVADVGAGSGYFTFRLARALPSGRVVAIDIEPEMVRHVHHRVLTEDASNVEVVLTTADDPGVPAEADLVFICDVLHHVSERQAWMNKLASAMQEGARLVLVEFKEGDLPNGPPADLKISKQRMIELATAAGLSFSGELKEMLPYQTILVFDKAQERGG